MEFLIFKGSVRRFEEMRITHRRLSFEFLNTVILQIVHELLRPLRRSGDVLAVPHAFYDGRRDADRRILGASFGECFLIWRVRVSIFLVPVFDDPADVSPRSIIHVIETEPGFNYELAAEAPEVKSAAGDSPGLAVTGISQNFKMS